MPSIRNVSLVVAIVVVFIVGRILLAIPWTKKKEVVALLDNGRSDEYRELVKHYSARLAEDITYERLQRALKENKDYKMQFPFPHGRSDGLFPQDVLDAVSLEIPDDPPNAKDGCIKGTKCFAENKQMFKNTVEDEARFGPATLSVFRALKSPLFTKFLENLTGIHGLIPDPEYRGSGIHQTLPGGHLGIHADFNLYKKFNIHRRVNCFVFLNEDWKTEFGGQLELWHRDLQSCGAKYDPLMNRFLVFSSTDFSYHGHPHPLTAPYGRSRRSLALYYYTKTRPASECVGGDCYGYHTTLFQETQCADCEDAVCKNLTASRQLSAR